MTNSSRGWDPYLAAERQAERIKRVPAACGLFDGSNAPVIVGALLADYEPLEAEVSTAVDTILRIKGPEWMDANPDALVDAGVHGLEKLADLLAAEFVEDLLSAAREPAPEPPELAAREWLAENVRNVEGSTTGRLALAEYAPAALAERFRGADNRHDEMVSLTRALIRAALETDAEGLLSLLETVEKAFYGAFTGGAGERRPDAAEFDRAVRWEIEKIRGGFPAAA